MFSHRETCGQSLVDRHIPWPGQTLSSHSEELKHHVGGRGLLAGLVGDRITADKRNHTNPLPLNLEGDNSKPNVKEKRAFLCC